MKHPSKSLSTLIREVSLYGRWWTGQKLTTGQSGEKVSGAFVDTGDNTDRGVGQRPEKTMVKSIFWA